MANYSDITIQKILPTVNKILKRYSLCNYCLGRLFSKQLGLSSNRLLGKRLNISNSSNCYICKNVYHDLNSLLELMITHSTKYEFETFLVGVQIKPSIVDRDDQIRSEFKLVGADGIKTDITRELSKRFARKTGKTLNASDHDLIVIVNIRDKSCYVRAKPVIIYGRYTKTARGFPQKQKPCTNCVGKGCYQCNQHGIDNFESVEGKISKILFSKFGCTTINFTWIGGEDRTSRVLGNGRPFFAKIHNPIKRHPRFTRKMNLEYVNVHNCKIIDSLPVMPIKFSSTITIRISTTNLGPQLEKLKSDLHSPIIVYDDSGKRSEKSIYNVKYKKLSDLDFTLTIDVEGGLPIKRFVEGDDTNPNVGQILNTKCTCVWFDFLNVYSFHNN